MATAMNNTLHADDRRRSAGFIPAVITPELRAAIEREARSLLDAATFLIDYLNEADQPIMDLEPDADGEAEADEASVQPVTLSPDRASPLTYRPSARQQRAAYRRNGDRIPSNLRRLNGLFDRGRT